MQARLRREVPSRSVTELIRILEWEGIAEPGFLRRSTLQDQLVARGYSSRQMRIYSHDVTSARRFRKPWRNYLWQSDIKYGIHINGQPTYMKHVSRHRLFAILTGDCAIR